MQLETQREDLCAQIQAGQGETALLHQLKDKNHGLQEQARTHTHTHARLRSRHKSISITFTR